jgi:hypothetical protein
MPNCIFIGDIFGNLKLLIWNILQVNHPAISKYAIETQREREREGAVELLPEFLMRHSSLFPHITR